MLKSRILGLGIALVIQLFSVQAIAQDVKIELGPNQIGENQSFTISIVADNGSIKSYDQFPDIPGLRKRGTSSS